MGIYRFFEIFVAPEQFLCYYMRCKFRELINAQIAQLVEQRTENPRVAGSIPALGIFLFSNNQSASEKLSPQSPTNCDAHLAERLFQTRSGKKPPPKGRPHLFCKHFI